MKKALRVFSIIMFCVGFIFMILAFYKKDVYEYSEYSFVKDKNAYVGGDAYNFIINGTYFTGYMVLAGSLYIMGTIFLVGSSIIGAIEKERQVAITQGNENSFSAIPVANTNNQPQVQEKLPEL